jgi:hypothetical protein
MNDSAEPHFVVITIWEHIEPIDRGERYEDPLDEALGEEAGEVVGGGSLFTQETGIESVDIELELASLDSLPLVKSVLEKQGVPKGSEIKYSLDGQDIVEEFGFAECLAVFIDGVGLPDSVYQDNDIDVLANGIIEALGDDGEIRASFAGEQETSLLIVGIDAEELFKRLESILVENPLCQNARIVIGHGKPSLDHREIRLPMHIQ